MKCDLNFFGAALVALSAGFGGFGIVSADAKESAKCAGDDQPRAVYTMSNAAANAVLVYQRACDGSLTLKGTFPTGGRGTGAWLGNQGGVILSEDHRFLLVVDAGSNDITVFAVQKKGLTRYAKVRAELVSRSA